MTDAFTKYMQAMHSLFNDEFIDAYQELEPKIRRRVLPYLQSIYRRWYHSTFIDNIHFSPANIVSTIGYYCDASANTHIAATINPPFSKNKKVDMKVLSYSTEAHPIVADLRQLIKTCTPHIDLCEEWCFSDAQAIKIAKKLSLYDPYYASFLLEVACKLNLLTRMPSLYVQRVQVSPTASTMLTMPDAELLIQIVEAVIEMTAMGLQNTLPAPVSMFTEEGLRDLLLNPLTTDEILEQAFSALGYDLSVLSLPNVFNDPDDFSEEAEAAAELMSGIFVLGIMLDRLFFTPFGYFLRLIRPIYAVPFNIEVEIAQYAFAIDQLEDEFAAFFAPCTSYSLTELGLDLFQTEPTDRNYFDSRMVVPKEVLDAAFTSSIGIRIFIQAALESIPVSEMPNAIYTFCVYDIKEPEAWAHLQIPKALSLHHLYEEIIDAFYCDEGDTYSFFHGKIENPFVEYAGGIDSERLKKAGNGKRDAKAPKKDTNTPLALLDFGHVGEMLLVINGIITQKFTLEWLSESVPKPSEHYPQISKLSAAMQELLDALDDEDDDDFLDFNAFDLDL